MEFAKKQFSLYNVKGEVENALKNKVKGGIAR
jgi:hypothetical protein